MGKDFSFSRVSMSSARPLRITLTVRPSTSTCVTALPTRSEFTARATWAVVIPLAMALVGSTSMVISGFGVGRVARNVLQSRDAVQCGDHGVRGIGQVFGVVTGQHEFHFLGGWAAALNLAHGH